MKVLGPRWSGVLAILVAITAMLGCQAVQSGSQNTTPPPPTGTLAANHASLGFGNVQVGNNSTISETITNTGSGSVTISQANLSGAGYSISGLTLPTTLNASQSATVSVSFAPQSAERHARHRE